MAFCSCQSLGGAVEAAVADLFEPIREDVLDEPLEESDRGEGDGPAVLGPERDRLICDVEQTRIRDPDPVRIATKVGQHETWGLKGPLEIDVPVLARQGGHEGSKGTCGHGDPALALELAQGIQHLSPKQLGQRLHGEEELLWDVLEPGPVQGQAARTDQDVNVGVEAQVSGPGVEHEGEPESDSQPGFGQFQQGFAGTFEQGSVKLAWMAVTHWAEVLRQGEHGVVVRDRQDRLTPAGQPVLLGQCLTFGAVAVAAGVVAGLLPPAAFQAEVRMPAQGGGAADGDGRQGSCLHGGQELPSLQGLTVPTDDVGNVERRSAHLRGRARRGGSASSGATAWRRGGRFG